MLLNFFALLGIVVGLILFRGGMDSLIEWRAWFLCISGLALFLFGVLTFYFKIRRLKGKDEAD